MTNDEIDQVRSVLYTLEEIKKIDEALANGTKRICQFTDKELAIFAYHDERFDGFDTLVNCASDREVRKAVKYARKAVMTGKNFHCAFLPSIFHSNFIHDPDAPMPYPMFRIWLD